jgi:predicted nucleic acid-binding protein
MTKYLLDTNAISEAPKKEPNSGFMKWFTAVDELSLFSSCLVLGEIKKGICLISDGNKRKNFNVWLDEIIVRFDGRVIEIDNEVSLKWGELIATGQRLGKAYPVIDSLIAAQCLYHHLTLVTRNIKDFEQFSDLNVFCPWSDD